MHPSSLRYSIIKVYLSSEKNINKVYSNYYQPFHRRLLKEIAEKIALHFFRKNIKNIPKTGYTFR